MRRYPLRNLLQAGASRWCHARIGAQPLGCRTARLALAIRQFQCVPHSSTCCSLKAALLSGRARCVDGGTGQMRALKIPDAGAFDRDRGSRAPITFGSWQYWQRGCCSHLPASPHLRLAPSHHPKNGRPTAATAHCRPTLRRAVASCRRESLGSSSWVSWRARWCLNRPPPKAA
jgi:hypothetical protein